ncbi:hypothetical protein Peur_037391 [Populus x canadensis]
MRPPKAMAQDSYNRGQEHPFFAGLLRGNESGGRSISRSTSDIGDFRSKNFSGISGKSKDLPIKDSVSDILEPFEQTAFGTLWNIPASTSFEFQRSQFDSSVDSGGTNDLVKIPPPQSAASFYNGYSPQFEILESCDSIMRLNLYLKARKNDVSGGVPGKFLHAVIGQDVSDVGSLASIIMHAFYLNETLESDEFCTIDLSYYDLFGCLKLDLRNGHKLQTRQVTLKEAVVEVFNCRKAHFGESVYPWVENVTLGQLAGILMDTGNLTSPHCTTKDKYMATLLLNGAGRFGSNGFYQIMRYKMYNISDLKVVDILRKDFKKWTSGGLDFHYSPYLSFNMLLIHCSARTSKPDATSSRLNVSNREILVSAETMELTRNLLSILSSNASHLPHNAMHQPGLRVDMKAFEIDKVTSRKTIERLLEEFGGASRG